jgi:predicted RNase H-like nuclease (RuvC/YqgF family)
MGYLEKNNETIAQTKKDQDEKLRNKENEIQELRKKIEEMSAEFAKMLKDTLEKMQERIRLAEWDNDNDPGVIKKIKEINNLN